MPDDKNSTINDESKSLIEMQVKNGKACKFFLMTKGASIQTLGVFKKGAFGPQISKARKDGHKGDVTCGVVTGAGSKLFFLLPGTGDVAAVMKVDSWEEKPPTKSSKLREILKDNGLSFKPSLHIITDVAHAVDPDAETGVPVPPPPPGTEVGNDEAIETTATISPPAPPVESAPVAPPAPEPDENIVATKLAEALKSLKPLIDKVVNADPNRKAELLASFAQVANQIKAKQFDPAKQGIADLAKLLKSLAAPAPASTSTESDDRMREFTERRTALEPRLLAAQKSDRDKGTKLGAVWDYAAEQARAGNFANAFKSLDQLEKILDSIPSAPTSDSNAPRPGSLVAYRKAMLAWRDARLQARAELAKLEVAILDQYEQDEDFPELLDTVGRVYDILASGNLDGRLLDTLDDALNASGPERIKLQQECQRLVKDYLRILDSNELVAAIDHNPFVSIKVRGPLAKALTDLNTQLSNVS